MKYSIEALFSCLDTISFKTINHRVYTLFTLFIIPNFSYTQPTENLSFNIERGFYNSPLLINIQADESSAIIRYTLDGSAPTPSTGLVYSSSIIITGTSTIRAIAYTPSDTTEIITHSYIYPNEVFNTDTDPQLVQSLSDIPSISIVTDNTINYGDPVKTSIEFLYPDNAKNHQINAGIRHPNGGAGNVYDKKTMRLYFKNEFGSSKLKYDIFKDAPYGEYSTDEFDKINLRYGSQDNIVNWWQIQPTVFLRNRWGYDTQLAMGWFAPHGTYMHVYINGAYTGMYHVHELPDESFQKSYRGGEKEDYDLIKNSSVVEGNTGAWNAAYHKLVDNNYAGFTEDVDIENYIDYHLISWYQGNSDWPQNNWYMSRRRADGEQFQFFLWDMDRSMIAYDDDPNVTASVASFNVSLLMQYPDFAIVMQDRIYKHFFADGALTPHKATERFEQRVSEIRKGTIAETARWGSSQADWLNKVDTYINDYFPQRTSFVINELIEEDYYADIDPPVYSQFGGQVFPGFQLTLLNSNNQGVIYYTTDGSDPRAPGGGISPTAQLYTTPFTLPNMVTEVRARVFLNSDWSAACPVLFYSPQDYSGLVINEIHYHPADTLATEGDAFEFIEIKNNGTNTIDLAGTKFTDGIHFTFNKNTIIPADSFIVLARDSLAFLQKYGFKPDGNYEGKLSNKGEKITFADPFDILIDSLIYNNVMTWDTLADGHGYSLELMSPDFDNALAVSWRHSQADCGTPRAENTLQCSITNSEIVINEINYKYNQAFLGIQADDWVELYNNTPFSYDLSDWSIVDSDSIYTIPIGTTILSGEYLVFARDTALFHAAHPTINALATNLGFSSNGDMIALLDQSGCPIDGLNYDSKGAWTSAANGGGSTLSLLAPSIDNAVPSSWTASGNYGGTPAAINTFNTCNSTNSLIINEINYKSPTSPFADDWVELHNISGNSIDISGWEFHNSQNFYTIPQETVIAAGDFHILVKNINNFTTAFPSVTNYSGNLGFDMSNFEEVIALFDQHRCPIDIVEYDSSAPWTDVPNSNGPTLSLIAPNYNNDLPGSWVPSTQGNAPNGTPAAHNNIPNPCNVGLANIIINEINYNSSIFNDSGDWLELHNTSAYLANLSGWTLQYQDTAYTFPIGTNIDAEGFLVLVKNTGLFTSIFPTVSNYISVPSLTLDDDNDALFLYTDLSCLMDSVAYSDSKPWSPNADGYDASLSLINPMSNNANSIHWMALQGTQTPGSSNEVVCGPGGILANLQLWLNAGVGIGNQGELASHGDEITDWLDQSPFQNNAHQPIVSEAPTYRENIINGHPCMSFDGEDDWYKINQVADVLSDEITIFTVIEPKAVNDDVYYLSTNDGGSNLIKFGHSPDGELIYDDDVEALSDNNFINKKVIISINVTPDTRAEGYINGVKAVPWTTDISSTDADRASIGQEFDGNGSDNETSDHWAGNLAEVIIYDKILSDNQRHKVETYLSIKYGISIPVSNHLYYQHTNYDKNIAGIGMDLTQCLLQRESMNADNGAIVSMEAPVGLNQGEFLVWGNNGETTAATPNQVPSTTLNRLTREWRVTKTNDVGKVNVSFDVSGLSLNLNDINNFAILIDNEIGDFSNARTHFTGRSISGNIISFTNVEFDDADWFTLAVEQQACPTNGIVVPASICALNPNAFVPNIIMPNASYQWSFQQGNPASFSGANVSTYWNSAGIFTAELAIAYEYCVDIISKNIEVDICSKPPLATNDYHSMNEDDTLIGNLMNNDSDPFNHTLSLDTTLIINPLNGDIALDVNGNFSYSPDADFYGVDNFSYRICNNGTPSFCDTADVVINVVYINDAPFAIDDYETILNDDFATGNLLTNDSDVENHTITPTSSPIIFPQNGTTIIQSDGTFFYYPSTGFIGVDSFTYQVCDNGTPQACSEGTVQITVEQSCVDIQLHLWLEGAYNTTADTMHTNLNTIRKMLPGQSLSTQTGQPYSVAPWNYLGTEGASWTDTDYTSDVVDWVLVSFRTDILKNTQVGSPAAALLLADGSIQIIKNCALPSGTSPLYVVVQHRNHIGVMTPNPVPIVNRTLVHDFRVANSYRDITSFGQKELVTGVWGMFSGDGSQTDDVVSYDINGVDKSLWSVNNGVFGKYLFADYNMDGDVNGSDRIFWETNNGITSRVPK